ncbi:DUF3618 domain-containing protein [Nonomuraea sp. MG754425]|uniref:DUF3618 domain-containing protein n=1 Tax=Nonomuraea sp. MG754425 TaxID=2570319 RepID=UPI001F3D6230|nr:DUF3618 domain-containing protein [Nonomuraea sp. MG754425]MCF6476462.1 DUF3618 domain-containing protein [Nonomuraea sp. MG754425]
MSETDPGYNDRHAGDVGARRATVGTPTEGESINVPPTRPGAAENARRAQRAREKHETFVPEAPVEDEQPAAAGWPRAERGPVRWTGGDDNEEDALRRDIEQTRRELGETVSQLAGKADVKARAGHAAEVAKDRAGHAAEVAKDRAGHAAEVARDRAGHAAGAVKGKASEVAGKVREGTPDQVKDAAAQARRRPALLVAAAGAVTAFLVARRMMRRHRTGR